MIKSSFRPTGDEICKCVLIKCIMNVVFFLYTSERFKELSEKIVIFCDCFIFIYYFVVVVVVYMQERAYCGFSVVREKSIDRYPSKHQLFIDTN